MDVDLLRVRNPLTEAANAQRDGDTGQVAELLGAALRLWRGQPFADIPLVAAQPKVMALAAEPFDEPAQARLIRAYHAAGQRARAFQVYHDVRDRLVDELGVDPGTELRAAHTALLHDDVPVAAPSPVPRVPRQLPAEPLGFAGRTDELSSLDELLPAVGAGGR